MCKQHASLQDLEQVLASTLIVQPTNAMRDALRELYRVVPRWDTMRSGVVQ